MYTNADSLLNKREELANLINSFESRPHLIAITEVKSKNKFEVNVSEFYLEGYVMVANNFEKNSRGILVYGRSDIRCSEVIIESEFEEIVMFKVKLKTQQELQFGIVYRSPNSSSENNARLFDLIKKVSEDHENLFLIGDFNFPKIDWNTWTVESGLEEKKFLDVLRDSYMIQYVTEPTRYRSADYPHTLDLVMSNADIITDIDYLSPLGNSDHSVLLIGIFESLNDRQVFSKLNYNKGNYDEMSKFLDIDWETVFGHCGDNIECMWKIFKDKVYNSIERFIPVVKDFHRSGNNKWTQPLPFETRELIRSKHKLWKNFIKTKNAQILTEYKTVRNKVRAATRRIRIANQEKIAKQCKLNPKVFWSYINSKRKTHGMIGDIKNVTREGKTESITDDEEKAGAFNEYFSSVFSKEGQEDFEPMSQLNFEEVQGEAIKFEVSDILMRLGKINTSKAAGVDGIHPRILYELRTILALPLKLLFEYSFKNKVLPEDWTSADVAPIFKKGSKSEVNNYRPISLTSVCCKIMEAIIRDNLIKYFDTNKLFSERQFGFLHGRSTVSQLLRILDNWTESLELGGQIDVIYTDLEKAFDKIPHRRLLSKLKSYGVNTETIQWIAAFLKNRRQRVKINGVYSFWTNVLSGVPQGSILGPILFIIYINDIVQCCSKSELFLYADDGKIFRHIQNPVDKTHLQTDVNKIKCWLDRWLVSLNINKCKVMSFGHHTLEENKYYFIRGGVQIELENVNSIKDLGVSFDSRLKFDQHVHEKINKAYGILGIIKRNFRDLSTHAFIMLYKALVRPHLEYANVVWGPRFLMLMEALEKVQMRATKLVTKISHYSYEDRLKLLKLPTLKYRRARGDMIEVYKLAHGIYDRSSSIALDYSDITKTRGNSFKLVKRQVHYDLRKYFFANRVVLLWNSLPDEVVTVATVNNFKVHLDNYWSNIAFKYDWKAIATGTGNIY